MVKKLIKQGQLKKEKAKKIMPARVSFKINKRKVKMPKKTNVAIYRGVIALCIRQFFGYLLLYLIALYLFSEDLETESLEGPVSNDTAVSNMTQAPGKTWFY